ncbi:MAG: calcium/sodium antiporter [bacterium]|nr:calcium/sodium antiporter [bacterium]
MLNIFLHLLSVIGGFVLLVKGADYLVDGATSLARRLKVSTLVIGLTVVAFGTSAPELAVSIIAALRGSSAIVLGNVNGSNVANILLILGITAMITRIPVRTKTVWREFPFMVMSGAILVLLLADQLLANGSFIELSQIDGFILLAGFLMFLYYMFLSARRGGASKTEEPAYGMLPSWLMTFGGLVGLIVGGHFTVEGASGIAIVFGVSETLIGLTIVAIGTSLPELVASITAAKKSETDLAVGNIVGSVIFNIFFVLGMSSVIQPMIISHEGFMDSVIALGVMVVLFVAVHLHGVVHREKGLDKHTGIFFLLAYVAYVIFVIVRG